MRVIVFVYIVATVRMPETEFDLNHDGRPLANSLLQVLQGTNISRLRSLH